MDREFLKAEDIKPWVSLRYIHDILFIWTEGEIEFENVLERSNSLHPNLKFTREKSKTPFNFLNTINLRQISITS